MSSSRPLEGPGGVKVWVQHRDEDAVRLVELPPARQERPSSFLAIPLEIHDDHRVSRLPCPTPTAGRDDSNPKNWPWRTKMSTVVTLAWISFVTPLASSLLNPAAPQVARDLHIKSSALQTFVLSAYTLGSAMGQLLVAPLSEIFGRLPMYHISNAFFLAFSLACGFVQTGTQLIVLRFFEACLGTACLTVGGATVADLFVPEERASAMGLWAMGAIAGPAIGPVVGGIIAQHLGWRAIFRILAIIAVFDVVLCVVLLRETYAPLVRKRSRPRGLHWKQLLVLSRSERAESFWISMARPLRLLTLSPVVAALTFYGAATAGVSAIAGLFAAGFVFQRHYGFTVQQSGFVYLSLAGGMIVGLAIAAKACDVVAKRIKARGRQITPEERIPTWTTFIGVGTLAAGLLMFGWTVQHEIHWAAPVAGYFVLGFGTGWIMIPVQQYLIDSFELYASSVMAANGIVRNTIQGFAPMGALEMYDKLGMGWGNSLLAGIAVVAAIAPEIVRIFGARLRIRFGVVASEEQRRSDSRPETLGELERE